MSTEPSSELGMGALKTIAHTTDDDRINHVDAQVNPSVPPGTATLKKPLSSSPTLHPSCETIAKSARMGSPTLSGLSSPDDALSNASEVVGCVVQLSDDANGSEVKASSTKESPDDGSGLGHSAKPGVDDLEGWLSGNILEFMNFIHTYSTSGDREKRWAIIRYVQRQTSIFLGQSSSLHPSQVAIPFGSFTYGMYLPWASDLDIVITDQSFLDNPEVMMKRLASHFSKQKNHCVQSPPVVVSRTRVPFIQLLLAPPHHARGLIDEANCGLCRMGYCNLCPSHSAVPVQLSLSVKDHAGLVSTASVNYLVAHYPVIRGLVLVLKHILVSENLNSPFEGGLSSHSLIILVCAFVRHFHPHDHNLALPGTIFLQLLCWYGGIEDGHHRVSTKIEGIDQTVKCYDPALLTVDIKADTDCFRLKVAPNEATEMLYVVDPLDTTHNAARSMWRWPDLKTTLTNAYWHVYSGKWWSAMGAAAQQ